MSDIFRCDDKNLLIAYLYDEVDARERRLVEEHLQTCAACAGELGALRGVRSVLSAWAPPAREFGFSVMPTVDSALADGSARRSLWGWREMPAWARAVAALFVLAVGAGAANLHIRSGPEGFVVTTGWLGERAVDSSPAGIDRGARGVGVAAGPRTPVASPRETTTGPAAEDWRPALAALESRMRGELQALRQASAARPASAAAASADAAMLRRVRALIDESEKRQQRELALRLAQLSRDLEIQRAADLRRIERSVGEIGLAGAEVRQMMNYLRRVSVPQR